MSAVITQPPQLGLASERSRSGSQGNKIKIAQFGLGLIGIEAMKLAATKPWAQVVGGVDIDPAKAGRPLSDFAVGSKLGDAVVYSSFEQMMGEVQPDVVLHTAGSKIEDTFDQIEPMIRGGVSVVSSCEELLFPRLRAPERSDVIDELAKAYEVGILGTGVNPGFVMDVLPVVLTGVNRTVRKIRVERVVNASTRRMMLQKKVGSGMDPDEFRALWKAGKAGHAGFRESAAMICHAMGWDYHGLVETCEPMIAPHDITTQFFHVKKGLCCGIHQTVTAHVNGQTPLMMDLKMYLDAEDPHDRVVIDGDPQIDCLLQGGLAGDHATVAALVNAVPRVLKAGGGLHIMTDLAAPSWC